MNNQEKLKHLKWLVLQLRVKEEELRNLCRRYPKGNGMTAYLRVASHSLDEPPSPNEALELAKAIHRLREEIEELKRELEMAA